MAAGPTNVSELLERMGALLCPRQRVAELKVPGQVLLKLAVRGFGVQLQP